MSGAPSAERGAVRASAPGPHIALPNVVRAELTKFGTLPSVRIVTFVIVAVFAYMHASAIPEQIELLAGIPRDVGGDGVGALRRTAVAVDMIVTAPLNAGLLLPVLGAVIGGVEFRAGQIGLSVVAVPDRARFVAGKVLSIVLVALALWLLFVVVGGAIASLATAGSGSNVLGEPEVLLACARLLLFVAASMLIGFGITLLTRSALVGVVVAVGSIVLVITQVVAMVSPTLDAILVPFSAARNLLLQGRDAGPPMTAGAGHGALVLAGWALASVGTAAFGLMRKDAR